MTGVQTCALPIYKTKVIDRALKLEAIKLKMSDDEWGAGFGAVDDEDE